MTTKTIILQDEKRRAMALKVIESLSLDELWAIQIEPYKPKRSSQANRRYWALLQAFSDKTGHEPEELHEMFKVKFLVAKAIIVGDMQQQVYPSTARMKTKEFAEFMEKVERWGISTLGVWLE